MHCNIGQGDSALKGNAEPQRTAAMVTCIRLHMKCKTQTAQTLHREVEILECEVKKSTLVCTAINCLLIFFWSEDIM